LYSGVLGSVAGGRLSGVLPGPRRFSKKTAGSIERVGASAAARTGTVKKISKAPRIYILLVVIRSSLANISERRLSSE
jgi:hypothetical protein